MALADDLRVFVAKPEFGNAFNTTVWKGHLRYRRELEAHEGPILRHHVFAKAQNRTMRGIVWALVWGYPRGKQPGDARVLRDAMTDLGSLAAEIDVLRDETPCASQMLERLNGCRKGLATASTTKVAYFAGLQTQQGPALIFDQQAITAIFERNDPEFADLLNDPVYSRHAHRPRDVRVTIALQDPFQYALYGKQLNRLASELDVRADDIERFLYVEGRKVRAAEGAVKRKLTRQKKAA